MQVKTDALRKRMHTEKQARPPPTGVGENEGGNFFGEIG
jgi:hypothetical protein